MSTASEHTWTETEPGCWRRSDGKYLIWRTELPGERPALATVYTLRKRDADTLSAWGEGWTGIHLGEHFSLDDAQRWAGNDDYADECHAANNAALDAVPALASAGFYWWISDGTSRARLAVARNDEGRLVARVTGMSRGEHEYEPVTVAEVDITEAMARESMARRAFRWARAIGGLAASGVVGLLAGIGALQVFPLAGFHGNPVIARIDAGGMALVAFWWAHWFLVPRRGRGTAGEA